MRLIWSPSARDDLVGIDRYLSQLDPVVAMKVLLAIRNTANRLLEYPRIGRAVSAPFRVLGVRDTAFLIVYRLHGGAIEIIRIRHDREDWRGEIEAEF